MKCTGTGTVTAKILLTINLQGSGEDLDDCYGPASDDLDCIKQELEHRISHLVEGILNHYKDAEKYGMSTIAECSYGTVYEFLSFDNSGEIDDAYDRWVDDQMLGSN